MGAVLLDNDADINAADDAADDEDADADDDDDDDDEDDCNLRQSSHKTAPARNGGLCWCARFHLAIQSGSFLAARLPFLPQLAQRAPFFTEPLALALVQL
jgi:hypothetical protein